MMVGDNFVHGAKMNTVNLLFFLYLNSKRNVSGRFWGVLTKILGTVFFFFFAATVCSGEPLVVQLKHIQYNAGKSSSFRPQFLKKGIR